MRIITLAIATAILLFAATDGRYQASNYEREVELLESIEKILAERGQEKEHKREEATDMVTDALNEGIDKANRMVQRSLDLRRLGAGQKKKSSRRRHSKSTPETRMLQRIGYALLQAKKSLVKKTGMSLRSLSTDPYFSQAWKDSVSSLTDKSIGKTRSKRQTAGCSSASDTYRTLDGTCNNINNENFGAAFTTQRRDLAEAYSDNIDEPRRSVIDNGTLPNPRVLSNTFFKIPASQTESEAEGSNTIMSMNWGQFIDHDMVLTPTQAEADGSDITCCNSDGPLTDRDECLGIELTPERDLNNAKCMEFTRSSISPDTNLNAGKQVTNEITAFLDASMIYGSSDKELAALMNAADGKMIVKDANRGDLLPEDSSSDSICTLDGKDSQDYCQKAGDVRVNVQPGLGLLHLLFVKEHNRIVDNLAAQGWTDSTAKFNEARKIVGAEIQHITFNEYFDNLFTDQTKTQYGLDLLTLGHFTGYDDSCDPGISVEFATAAFRFGHSQIKHQLAYMKEDYSTLGGTTKMENTLKNPHMLINKAGNKILDLVRYMTTVQASRADEQYEDAVRNHLFNDVLDLASLNIQRGRDHGMPSYVKWREMCGLPIPSGDNDWAGLQDIRFRRELRETYKSVYDVDLYVGGILENRIGGDYSYVGPTFACILGEQFRRLRNCDRFWYERPEPEGFSEEKLAEIRKVTLSAIICDNAGDTTSDNLPKLPVMQRDALKDNTNRNDCTDERRLPRMDLSKWQPTKK